MYKIKQGLTFRKITTRKIIRTILLSAFILCRYILAAQDQQVELVRAIRSGELPEIDINCITQDSAGFLWIGTWKGLYRYDGQFVDRIRPGAASLQQICQEIG